MKKIDIKVYLKKVNMDKLKQYTLVIMALLLFAVGFINYNPNNNEDEKIALVENKNEDMIGDVQLVSSGSVVENVETGSAIVENTDIENNYLANMEINKNSNNDVNKVQNNNTEINNIQNDYVGSNNNNNSNDYFENIRIERDAMYSRMLETYQKMIDNEKLVETQKTIAIQEIEKITNNQNAIMISENLIKNKGFEDAVVLVNSDIINVVVKSAVLNNEDIGKIQNIIEREFGTSLENVNISNKN